MSHLIIFLLISFVYFYIYNKIFKKISKNSKIISGSGFIIFPLILLFNIILANYFEKNIIIYFIIISFLTFIYWYDDYKNLPIIIRINLQFLSGFLCFYLFHPNSLETEYLIILSAIFGIWSIILANTINFYDGADLNVSLLSLLFLIFFTILYPLNEILYSSNYFLIIFLIVFCYFNISHNNYYIGDSGCFAIFNYFNLLILLTFDLSFEYIILLMSILYLPLIDVFFVILKRLYLGEKITTRNNYHLYQQIQLKFGAYYYLIPLFIFPVLIYLLSYYFKNTLNYNIYTILILNLFLISILYFMLQLYLTKEKTK